MKWLIINADDFGLTDGVTQAIIDCHRAGSVTSTTMMVSMPGTSLAAKLAQENPSLGVGLHFNITLGMPAALPSEISSLVSPQSGQFRSRRSQERAILRGLVQSGDVRTELEAQLQRLRELGVNPTHIDSHQHMHVLPAVFDAVAAVAIQYDLPVRIPWRWKGRSRQTLGKWLRGQVLRACIARNVGRWRGKIRTNGGHCSVFDLINHPTQVHENVYRELLVAERGIVELMVHPGPADLLTSSMISISQLGLAEFDILRRSKFAHLPLETGFHLCNFRDIPIDLPSLGAI